MLVSNRNAALEESRFEMRTSLSSCRCIEVSVRTKVKTSIASFLPPPHISFDRNDEFQISDIS